MRAYLALCVAAAFAGAARAKDCTVARFGNDCYQKHDLPISGGEWRLMDIDRYRNILYLRAGDQLRQCDMDTGRCDDVSNTWSIRWLTVDQRTGETYAKINDGGALSLYKLDLVNNDIELLVHGRVYYITFKDKLYYSTYDNGIYVFEDGKSQVVAGTEQYSVYKFFVDINNDIYFKHNVNGEFVISKLSGGVVDRTVYWDDNYLITGDTDGNAVFIHQHTHAVYKATDGALVEIGEINDSIYHTGLFETPLFDKKNDVIYRTDSLGNYYHLRSVKLRPY